jgi:hypothetical protein
MKTFLRTPARAAGVRVRWMSTKEAEAQKPPAGKPYTAFKLGVPKESFSGERRVATTPQVVAKYAKLGLNVCVEKGAGEGADISDKQYVAAGATILSREEVFKQDMIFKVSNLAYFPL